MTTTKTKTVPLQGYAASLAAIFGNSFVEYIADANRDLVTSREAAHASRIAFDDALATAGIVETSLTDPSSLYRYGIMPDVVLDLQRHQAQASADYRAAGNAQDHFDVQVRHWADRHFAALATDYVEAVTAYLDGLDALQPAFESAGLISSLIPQGSRFVNSPALVELANTLPHLVARARAELAQGQTMMAAAVVA